MLAGQAATYQKFTVDRNFMMPADLDGSTPPPTGSPNYFYTMMDDAYWPSNGFPGADRLEVWEYHVDFDTPANSAFVQTASLPTETVRLHGLWFFQFILRSSAGWWRACRRCFGMAHVALSVSKFRLL